MSAPKNPLDFPKPAARWQGVKQLVGNVTKSLLRAWQPKGTTMEGGVSLLSRFSLRLIDRATGDAHSADELKLGARNKLFPVALASLRVAAAWKDSLPDAPAGNGGALGLGDAAGSVITGTSTNNTAATESFGFFFTLPENYRAGQPLKVRIRQRYSVARFAASALSVVAKRLTADGALDATDLCTTAGIDTKAAVAFTDRDFNVNGNAAGDELAPGMQLWIVVSQANIDTGGNSAGVGTIAAVSVIVPVLG